MPGGQHHCWKCTPTGQCHTQTVLHLLPTYQDRIMDRVINADLQRKCNATNTMQLLKIHKDRTTAACYGWSKGQKWKGRTLRWTATEMVKSSDKLTTTKKTLKEGIKKERNNHIFQDPTTSYQTCVLSRNWHTVLLNPVGNRATSRLLPPPQKKKTQKKHT